MSTITNAGTTTPTMLMDLIKTTAATVTAIGSTRVFQGKKRFTDAQNHENDVRGYTEEGQAAFFFWINSVSEGAQTTTGECLITGYLEFNSNQNNTSDLNKAYDVCFNLQSALSQESTFATIGCRPRNNGIKWERWENDDLSDNVLVFLFSLTYTLPISCGV